MSFVLIPSCHIKRSLEFDKAKNLNFATTAQQRDQDTHTERVSNSMLLMYLRWIVFVVWGSFLYMIRTLFNSATSDY